MRFLKSYHNFKLYEELSIDTYANTYHRLRKLGYDDRAMDIKKITLDNLFNGIFEDIKHSHTAHPYIDIFYKQVNGKRITIAEYYKYSETLGCSKELIWDPVNKFYNLEIYNLISEEILRYFKSIYLKLNANRVIPVVNFVPKILAETPGKITEELNKSTLYNAKRKFKELGYDDRADNIDDHIQDIDYKEVVNKIKNKKKFNFTIKINDNEYNADFYIAVEFNFYYPVYNNKIYVNLLPVDRYEELKKFIKENGKDFIMPLRSIVLWNNESDYSKPFNLNFYNKIESYYNGNINDVVDYVFDFFRNTDLGWDNYKFQINRASIDEDEFIKTAQSFLETDLHTPLLKIENR